MEHLISYLIENKYTDNESSATKILENISDEFYQELLYESATEELARLKVQFNAAMRSGDQAQLVALSAKIKDAKQRSQQEYQDKGSPKEVQAPRTISGGRGPQTPKSGIRGMPDPREGGAPSGRRPEPLEQQADRLIGSSVPKPSYLSPSIPAHMQNQQNGRLFAADERGTRRGITGQSNQQRRSGSTGRYENPNRFNR